MHDFTSGNKKPELKNIKLGNQEFEVVDSYKYLGNVIQFNLRNVLDIEQKLQSFYSSYYSILRNFNHVNIQTFLFIFKSYCLPSYGLALWNGDNVFSHQIFKTFEIAYSGALKRICNVPKFTSSHHVAEMCDMLLFKHLVIQNQLRFFNKLKEVNNSIFLSNYTFMKNGLFFSHLFKTFETVYSVNILDNDIQALHSRIFYIQRNEERSNYFYYV